MSDQLTGRIELVDDPISVLLHACREDDYLVVLGHLAHEFIAEGPDQEVRFACRTILIIVNQSFIKVEY